MLPAAVLFANPDAPSFARYLEEPVEANQDEFPDFVIPGIELINGELTYSNIFCNKGMYVAGQLCQSIFEDSMFMCLECGRCLVEFGIVAKSGWNTTFEQLGIFKR